MTVADVLSSSGYSCRPLDEDHYLDDFECGHGGSLADWLRLRAPRFHAEDLCRVWILSPEDRNDKVLGFYTLSGHLVEIGSIARRERYNDRDNGSMIGAMGRAPAQLLGKFALDTTCQGKGLSKLLMACSYATYLAGAEQAGSKYLVVEARGARVIEFYESLGFVRSSQVRDGLTSLYRTTTAIRCEMAAILA
ncbi:MAG: GNAT family N-acetyltransferase [Propioniciclava sp.]|uniref:hypothetical protein n=1 Tax=Propioniciclava sp. TaxID=2038686 RepID=UPI0039E36B50